MKINTEKREITLCGNETVGQICDAISGAGGIDHGGNIRDWVIRVEPIEKIIAVPAPCCPRDTWPQFPQYPSGPIWVDPQPLTPLFYTTCCHGAH